MFAQAVADAPLEPLRAIMAEMQISTTNVDVEGVGPKRKAADGGAAATTGAVFFAVIVSFAIAIPVT